MKVALQPAPAAPGDGRVTTKPVALSKVKIFPESLASKVVAEVKLSTVCLELVVINLETFNLSNAPDFWYLGMLIYLGYFILFITKKEKKIKKKTIKLNVHFQYFQEVHLLVGLTRLPFPWKNYQLS
jgi:hypothetical protein